MYTNRPRHLARSVLQATTVSLMLFYLPAWTHAQDLENSTTNNDNAPASGNETCDQCCDELCTTVDCVNEAVIIEEQMNVSADPCTDFDDYVCGKFYATKTIKQGESEISFGSSIEEKNIEVLQAIVEDINSTAPVYRRNIKNFYQSCLNIGSRDDASLADFKASQQASDWPTLAGWDWCGEREFTLPSLAEKYARVFFSPFFGLDLKVAPDRLSRYVLHITESPHISIERDDLDFSQDNSKVDTYRKYIQDVTEEMGADSIVALNDARDLIILLIKMHKTAHCTKTGPHSDDHTEMKLVELDKKYPNLHFKKTIRAFFAEAGTPVYDSLRVSMKSSLGKYFFQLDGLLGRTDGRILQNLFSFEFARSRGMVTRRMRDLNLQLDKILNGRKEDGVRSKICIKEVAKYYKAALAKEFVQRSFPEESKDYVIEMFGRLKGIYRQALDKWTWLSADTKRKVVDKLEQMRSMLGYRDVDLTDEDLADLYKDYPNASESYYKTREALNHQHHKNWLKNLNKIFDFELSRDISPVDYRASYSPDNVLIVTAAYLQSPRFSLQFSEAHNFASLGHLLASRMSQAFDKEGREVGMCNKRGLWWQEGETLTFDNINRCFADQYQEFITSELDQTVQINKNFSSKVLLSDTAGLRQAHRAWKVKEAAGCRENKTLPGINLNADQLFFVTFAQEFCEKKTEERMRRDLERSYPIGKFRILGALRNSPEFAAAFNCPPGAPMHPPDSERCSLW